MSAPFAADLCGYREGSPSTSDSSAKGSIEWGIALFDALGVSRQQVALKDAGAKLEVDALAHFRTIRGDLQMAKSRLSRAFEQYTHLGAFEQFQSAYTAPSTTLDAALEQLGQLSPSRELAQAVRLVKTAKNQAEKGHQIVETLRAAMPQESLLKLDLTVGNGGSPPRLLLAVSCKWTLRTDRAQDCISQGNKLVSLRRGPMPHYAALTMEPRPSMLKLLAYGSGAVDCVYHVALPELLQAAEALVSRRSTKTLRDQADILQRMVDQRRLRDYDELIQEIRLLP